MPRFAHTLFAVILAVPLGGCPDQMDTEPDNPPERSRRAADAAEDRFAWRVHGTAEALAEQAFAPAPEDKLWCGIPAGSKDRHHFMMLLSDPASRRTALAMLDHKDRKVRYACAANLAMNNAPPFGAEQRIAACMREEIEPEVWRLMAKAMGRLETPQAADALLELLDGKAGKLKRTAAALNALAGTRQPDTAEVFLKHLNDPATAMAALRGLALCGDPLAVPQIINFIGKLPDDQRFAETRDKVRRRALVALWCTPDKQALEFVLSQGGKPTDNVAVDLMARPIYTRLPKFIVEWANEPGASDRKRFAYDLIRDAVRFRPSWTKSEHWERWKDRYERLGPRLAPILAEGLSDPHSRVREAACKTAAIILHRVEPIERDRLAAALVKAAENPELVTAWMPLALDRIAEPVRTESLLKLSRRDDGIARGAADLLYRRNFDRRTLAIYKRLMRKATEDFQARVARDRAAVYFQDAEAGDLLLEQLTGPKASDASHCANAFSAVYMRGRFVDREDFKANPESYARKFRRWWKQNRRRFEQAR